MSRYQSKTDRPHLSPERLSVLDGLFAERPGDSDRLVGRAFAERTGRVLERSTVSRRRRALGLPARHARTPLEPDEREALVRMAGECPRDPRLLARRFQAETGRRIAHSTAWKFARAHPVRKES